MPLGLLGSGAESRCGLGVLLGWKRGRQAPHPGRKLETPRSWGAAHTGSRGHPGVISLSRGKCLPGSEEPPGAAGEAPPSPESLSSGGRSPPDTETAAENPPNIGLDYSQVFRPELPPGHSVHVCVLTAQGVASSAHFTDQETEAQSCREQPQTVPSAGRSRVSCPGPLSPRPGVGRAAADGPCKDCGWPGAGVLQRERVNLGEGSCQTAGLSVNPASGSPAPAAVLGCGKSSDPGWPEALASTPDST